MWVFRCVWWWWRWWWWLRIHQVGGQHTFSASHRAGKKRTITDVERTHSDLPPRVSPPLTAHPPYEKVV